jgi:guanine deaminase
MTSDFERWLSTFETLRMATVGSAHALGFGGKIGCIAPGYQADLVFLNLAHINHMPLGDLKRQVVFTENVDEAALPHDASAATARLFDENAPLRVRANRLEPLVGEFCRTVSCMPYHVPRLACEEVR